MSHLVIVSAVSGRQATSLNTMIDAAKTGTDAHVTVLALGPIDDADDVREGVRVVQVRTPEAPSRRPWDRLKNHRLLRLLTGRDARMAMTRAITTHQEARAVIETADIVAIEHPATMLAGWRLARKRPDLDVYYGVRTAQQVLQNHRTMADYRAQNTGTVS